MPGYRWQQARTESNLANLRVAARRLPQAEADFRRAIALQENARGRLPQGPRLPPRAGRHPLQPGAAADEAGRPPEAEAAFRKAIGLQRALVAEFPRMPDYRQKLAVSCLNLAILLEATDPPAGAGRSTPRRSVPRRGW
jgi:tetratricopeptide (TPR) repeat protein